MAESQREAISLALNSTKLNATNSFFREDPSLVFSTVTEARDQTLPGSLLARETLGTRLSKSYEVLSFGGLKFYPSKRVKDSPGLQVKFYR